VRIFHKQLDLVDPLFNVPVKDGVDQRHSAAVKIDDQKYKKSAEGCPAVYNLRLKHLTKLIIFDGINSVIKFMNCFYSLISGLFHPR